MQDIDILLLNPNSRWHGQRPWILVPYAVLLLTAMFKARGWRVALLDANVHDMSEAECERRLRDYRPRAIMVSAISVEYYRIHHTAFRLAKTAHPGVPTVLGGTYPTVMEGTVLADTNIDYLFLGHGEGRAVPFAEALLAGDRDALAAFPGIGYRDARGHAVVSQPPSLIVQIHDHVVPDYSLVDMESYLSQKSGPFQLATHERVSFVITSYGCPYNCTFCAARTISGRGVTFRPVADVLDEIDYLMGKGMTTLAFIDDCILHDQERFTRIITGCTERGYGLNWRMYNGSAWHLNEELLEFMASHGCTKLQISVESGSKRVLQQVMHKPLRLDKIPPMVRKCKEIGLYITANFIIGMPGETWNEILETIHFAEQADFDYVGFSIATPLPKTDMYRTSLAMGMLPEDFSFTDPRLSGFNMPVITTPEFTPFEIAIIRAYEYDRINFRDPVKRARIAQDLNMTLEELEEHRRSLRRNFRFFGELLDAPPPARPQIPIRAAEEAAE